MGAVLLLILTLGAGAQQAPAETLGSNLSSSPNASICEFKPEVWFPETRYCSVTQWLLDEDHAAPGGVAAPFDGNVVGWSVMTGARSANTGDITLALRTGKRGGPIYTGPEVLLPPVSPGTRLHFAESLPIEEGAQVALRIGITTRGTEEEVGAPLIFNSPKVGSIETFLGGTGEPWPAGGGLVEPDRDQVLLLQVEIVSTEDVAAPIVRRRFAPRQRLVQGAVFRVRSSEPGSARAIAKLRIDGLERSFRLASKRIPLAAERWSPLRLPVRGSAKAAIRLAEAEGRGITISGRGHVSDTAGNSRGFAFRLRNR